MSVHPDYRGKGIGRELVSRLNAEAFKLFDIDVIWGSSAEVGAIKLYRELGAMFYMPSIKSINIKMSPEDNVLYFNRFINNPEFYSWRLPSDAVYAYVNSDKASLELSNEGFSKI